MNSTEKVFCFTVVVLLFQITRNISTTIYIGVLFLSYTWLYITHFYSYKSLSDINVNTYRPLTALFILSLMLIPPISMINMEMNEFLMAIPRFLVTFPFILFCFLYKSHFSYKLIKQTSRIFCVFIALSALSLPYQIFFGRISFFATSGYREGLERYASLAGSLTSLGTLGALALVLLLFSDDILFGKIKKTLLIIVIMLGMFMSLQKAAVANVIICFVAFVLINGKSSFIKRAIFAAVLCISVYGTYFLFKETQFAIYIESIFRYSLSDSSLGIEQDLLGRFWERPYTVIIYHDMDLLDYIFGIGLSSLSGTMGLPNLPMAHNNYFDLLFSGGILHFVSYLSLMIMIPLKVIVKKSKGIRLNIIDRSYSIIIFLLLINMTIGAGGYYQPIAAVIIFITIFSYDKVSNSITIQNN